MIVSVGVGIGMQKEIKDKISAFEGDISIQSFNNTINENSINPILPSSEFLEDLRKFRGVENFDKIISKFGIVRTLNDFDGLYFCLLYTSPSPRDLSTSRMPSSA